jgi:hypothetical protein
LICGYVGTLFRTTNAGSSWMALNNASQSSLIAIRYIAPNTAIIAGYYGLIQKTTDNANTWTTMPTGTTDDLKAISFIDANTGWAVDANGAIIRTTTGGFFWELQQSNTAITLNGISMVNANTGTIVGNSATILHTTTGGANWYTQVSPVANITLYDVKFVDVNTGVAVGGNGTILRTTTGGEIIGIEPISNNVPTETSLKQNYPNPFNPSTFIEFDVESGVNSQSSIVNLKIYDILGNEIETLVNENLKPGTYRASWDASNYPSGIYFYTLTTENYTKTRKMILTK